MALDFKQRKHIKRQLWCAVFSHRAFARVKDTAEQYEALGCHAEHPLHYTFVSSAVVTYARCFVESRKGIVLPKQFSVFPNQQLEKVHKVLVDCRHMIYAHTDPLASQFSITARLRYDGTYFYYGYQANSPALGGNIFNDLVPLIDFQLERVDKHIIELLEILLPGDTIAKLLRSAGSNQTEVDIRWPKDSDGPNSW